MPATPAFIPSGSELPTQPPTLIFPTALIFIILPEYIFTKVFWNPSISICTGGVSLISKYVFAKEPILFVSILELYLPSSSSKIKVANLRFPIASLRDLLN